VLFAGNGSNDPFYDIRRERSIGQLGWEHAFAADIADGIRTVSARLVLPNSRHYSDLVS